MSAGDGQIVIFTLGMASLAVLLNLAPGIALGWLLARQSWPGKTLVETLVVLPLVMPPVATGLILLELLGRHGLLGEGLSHLGIEVVFTWKAVLLAMAVMSFPFMVRSARAAFESVNTRLEQVATTLGASPLQVAGTITLPLAGRGIASGSVLCFARALGEFGATILVAGNIPGYTTTLSTAIYSDILLGKDPHAFGFLAVSTILAFAAIVISEVLLRRSSS
jgi:molybdate transport system permease protein